jgi:nitrogen fixation/metabolism regulation signal transduction histidine kinase
MTHEFKTPLYTIMVSAELIKKPDILKNEAISREYLDIITQEANRLKTQIERVLRIASSDKDKFQLEKETFDIHVTIQKAAEVAQALISDSKGSIQFNLEAQQHLFYGDKMHMENVLYNLIENAIKYTDKVPEIMIRTYNTSGYLFVEVKDNGIGISSDQKKLIFDKFKTEKRPLAIMLSIIDSELSVQPFKQTIVSIFKWIGNSITSEAKILRNSNRVAPSFLTGKPIVKYFVMLSSSVYFKFNIFTFYNPLILCQILS